MNVRECLQTVNHLIEGLQDETKLTAKEKDIYGYTKEWYGSKKWYDRWKVDEYIAIERSDRNRVTKTMLNDMKKFLEKAQKMGFRGKVSFKDGYRHGMWASTRDFSTEEERKGQIVLYHSFETGSNYWQLLNEKNEKIGYTCDTEKSIKELIKDYSEGRILG